MNNNFSCENISSDFSFSYIYDENIDPNSFKDNDKLKNINKYLDNKLNEYNSHKLSKNSTKRQFGRDITIKAQNNYINNNNNLLLNKNSLKIKNTNEIIMNSFLDESSLTKKNYNSQNLANIKNDNYSFQNLNIYSPEKKVQNNPQYVVEYSKEIMNNVKNNEKINYPLYEKNFLKFHPKLSEFKRAVLVDWLIHVQYNFELLENTLFLTINLIDRMLEETKNIKMECFQLLGVTCMFIASKYEEIYPPELHDFLYLCGDKYKKKEILSYEIHILEKLNFDILCVNPFVFLDRYYLLYEVEKKEIYYMAQMLIELCYFSIDLMKYGPDLLAHSMLFLAMKIKNNKLVYSNKFKLYSGFTDNDVKNVIKSFWYFCKEFREDRFPSIFKKYSKKKYFNVSENIKVFFKKKKSILK